MGVVIALSCATAAGFGADAGETGDYLHFRLGMKYKAEKTYDKAIDEFRKVLAEYPDNYNVYLYIAEIRSAQGQPRLAIANLKQALTYNPGWSKALKMLADSYAKDGQFQKAIVEYQHYQQSCDPAERDSIQQVIGGLVEKIGVAGMLGGTEAPVGGDAGNSRNAAPAAEAMSAGPQNPKAAEAFKRALALYDRQAYDTMVTALRGVLDNEPGFAGAYYYGGIARYHLDDFGKAKINFAKAKEYREPTYAGAFCLGKIYGGEKRYTSAVAELTRYIQHSNSESGKKEARVLLAAYQRLKTTPAAKKTAAPPVDSAKETPEESEKEVASFEIRIDSLLSMVSVDTLSDAGQKLLSGIREFQAGNFDNAIREFKKTLASYPTGPVSVQCLYNSGICYCKLRLFREAENQFAQIIERYGRHELAGQALFLKALTLLERKDVSMAEAAFRQFLQNYRTHAWRGKAWEKLGDIYSELEQPKKAIDAYAQAFSATNSCPDQMGALFKSGGMYVAIGNLKRAYGSYDSVIVRGERCNIAVRVPDSYYRIADEKYKAKEYAGALEYYTKAVRKYPAFQETPWGLFQIGTIRKNMKKYREAIDTYKNLIKRYPEDYWAKQAQWKLDDAVWEHEYQATLR
jgi:tetratricopeptide (TPR) repeat protein